MGESTLKLAAGLDTTAAQEAAVAAIEAVARDAELDVVGAAVDSLDDDARAAREAARRSAEGILSGDVLESYLAGVESSVQGLPPPLPPLDGSTPAKRVTFAASDEATPAPPRRIAVVDEDAEGDIIHVPATPVTPVTPGSSGGSDKLRAARERRKVESAQKRGVPFSPHTEARAVEAERELSAAIALEAPKDPFAEGGEWWWTSQTARERAVMFGGTAPSAPSDRSSKSGSGKQLRRKELSDAEQRAVEAEKRMARREAELAKKMSAAEKKRAEESRKVLDGFREVSQALKTLEMDADVLEMDLSESSATMAAIESARNERSLAQMAQMARDARTIREKAEEEDEAVDAAMKEMTRQKVDRVKGLDYGSYY